MERIVTPVAPVNGVKNASRRVTITARPPGIQPTSAVRARINRRLAPPSDNAEQQALTFFEQAVAVDPEYTLPYLGIAAAVVCLANMGFAPPVQLLPKARAALDMALRLDPASPGAHAARATILARYEWDWQAAEQEYLTAIQLAPGLARTHHEYATEFLAMNGRFDQAYAEWRRARELDPYSPAIAYGYPWILLFHRRFVESEREFRRLLDCGEVYESERIGIALALMGQGKYLECLNEFSRIAACFPRPASMALHAWMLALAGKSSEARDRSALQPMDSIRRRAIWRPCILRSASRTAVLTSWSRRSRKRNLPCEV